MKNRASMIVMVVGLALLYPLQRWIDSTNPPDAIGDETLYFASGETIKKMSLGMDAIIADIYWIRTVQYFGKKVLETGQPLSVDTSKIRMDLLAPLLKIIVTLDPNALPAYRFGAIFLPERDLPAAIELLETGIKNNPGEWRLYQDLGYIYWDAKDYSKAAEWYERGGAIKGSPWWMHDMVGVLRIKGGSREVARQIYTIYLDSKDQYIRNQAILRLRQLKMLDELDLINSVVAKYKEETGSCPPNLRVLAGKFRNAGLTVNEENLPVDPEGSQYLLDQATCKANQAPWSNVPRS